MHLKQEYYTSYGVVFFVAFPQHMMSPIAVHPVAHCANICPITSDVNLDPLGKVVSTILFHREMACVSFITSNYFVGR